MLFKIYVNDLSLCLEDTIVTLFTDDRKCLSIMRNRQSSMCIELQNDIDSLFEWSQKRGMDFNI